jgi:MFS transporter, CP family, cyanate transporter
VPLVAQRLRDQRPVLVAVIAVWAVAIAGLLVAPATGTLLWMLLFGAASGSALSLALMLIVLRSPDAAHAAALSGMAQAIGYCLAATAPFLVGALKDLTGGWEVSVAMILLALVPTFVAGWLASRRALVGPPPDAATPVLRRT